MNAPQIVVIIFSLVIYHAMLSGTDFANAASNMKAILSAALLLVAAHMTNAHGTFEAMLNYAGTTPSGGYPVFSSIYASINGPIGWTFQPTTAINVNALGAFDYLMSGQSSLRVGLWDASGNLLASQTVSADGGTVGQSHYESIAPLLLLAGETYYVAAYSASGSLSAVVVTPDVEPNGYATMSPEIQLGQVAYGSGTGFSFPGTTAGNSGYAIIAPNFEFQAVPEPSTLALFGVGIMGWFVARRGTGRTGEKP